MVTTVLKLIFQPSITLYTLNYLKNGDISAKDYKDLNFKSSDWKFDKGFTDMISPNSRTYELDVQLSYNFF